MQVALLEFVLTTKPEIVNQESRMQLKESITLVFYRKKKNYTNLNSHVKTKIIFAISFIFKAEFISTTISDSISTAVVIFCSTRVYHNLVNIQAYRRALLN